MNLGLLLKIYILYINILINKNTYNFMKIIEIPLL